MWMDLRVLLLGPSVKNQGIGRISEKRKKSIHFMKHKDTAGYYKCCSNYFVYTSGVVTFELALLPSWHCFRNPDALDPRLCLLRIVR